MKSECRECGYMLTRDENECPSAECRATRAKRERDLAQAEAWHIDLVLSETRSERDAAKASLAILDEIMSTVYAERDAVIALLREVQAEAGNQSPARHALTPSTRDDIDALLSLGNGSIVSCSNWGQNER